MTDNLTRLLVARANERPDLVVGTVDEQISLSDALARAAGGAELIRRSGLRRSDRVALVATTSADYLVTWIACLLADVPVAMVNPTYPPELLGQMLDRLAPSLVITDLDDTDFIGQRRSIPLAAAQSWPDADPRHSAAYDADRFAVVSFMHTSGTTGVPKFCAQTHEYFLRLGARMSDSLGLVSTDRVFAPLPMFHINPFGYGFIGALTAGADALTVRKFSARAFWPIVKEHAITAMILHAPPVEILKRATTAGDAAGHSVRTMYYADAEFMQRFGIERAVSAYGSTEAAGVSHLHVWHLGDDVPVEASRYGGLPRVDVEDRLDETGEIFVRERQPGTLFAGYYSDGVLDPARDADGWFATGDLGRRTGDDLVFLERAAESIRVNGEFVPIPYVEARFGTIDSLDDLALWKRPGELVDDEVVLYVVADPVPVDVIEKVSAELPAFMRPSYVARVGRIPRDAAAGKVQRRLLPEEEVKEWIALS